MNIKEILRYLGYGHDKPDDATLRMIEEWNDHHTYIYSGASTIEQ